jgi:hypothetical protein
MPGSVATFGDLFVGGVTAAQMRTLHTLSDQGQILEDISAILQNEAYDLKQTLGVLYQLSMQACARLLDTDMRDERAREC